MSPAQFNALPPDAKLALAGTVLTKRELLEQRQRNRGATKSWEAAEAVKEAAELAADAARLQEGRGTRIAQARATLRPELERMMQAPSSEAAEGSPPEREALRVKAAALVVDSRDRAKAARAEVEAKQLYEQLKGAPSR